MKEESSEEQAKKGERGRKSLDIVKIQYGNVIIKPLCILNIIKYMLYSHQGK